MSKSKFGVLYNQLEPFKKYLPCHCYENLPQQTTYYVRTIDDSPISPNKKPKVREILIECLYCGARSSCNVEAMNIFEDELEF